MRQHNRARPALAAWAVTALLALIVSGLGPLVVVIVAQLVLPLDRVPSVPAHLVTVAVGLFYVSLAVSCALTVRAALNRRARTSGDAR